MAGETRLAEHSRENLARYKRRSGKSNRPSSQSGLAKKNDKKSNSLALGIGATVGTLAIGLGAGQASKHPDLVKEVAGGVASAGQDFFASTKKAAQGVLVEPVEAKPVSVFDTVFPSQNEKAREDAFIKLVDARDRVNASLNDDIVRHVNKEYADKLWEASGHDEAKFQVLMGMLLWESKGDPNATSDADAVGLFQYIRSVAEDNGMTVNDQIDERKDPDLMIKKEGEKFSKDILDTGSISAALQVQHMGLANYMGFARRYLENHYGLRLYDIVVTPESATDEARQIANYQADENLRTIRWHLIKNNVFPQDVLGEFADELQGTNFDKALEFDADVVGSYLDYAERVQALGLKAHH